MFFLLLILSIYSSCKETINSNLSHQIKNEIDGKFHGSILVRLNEDIIINDFFGNEKTESCFENFEDLKTNSLFSKNCNHQTIRRVIHDDSININICNSKNKGYINLHEELTQIIIDKIMSKKSDKKVQRFTRFGE